MVPLGGASAILAEWASDQESAKRVAGAHGIVGLLCARRPDD